MPSSNKRLNDLLDWANNRSESSSSNKPVNESSNRSRNRFSSKTKNSRPTLSIGTKPPESSGGRGRQSQNRSNNSRNNNNNSNKDKQNYLFWIGIVVVIIVILIAVYIMYSYYSGENNSTKVVKQMNNKQHIITPARTQTPYYRTRYNPATSRYTTSSQLNYARPYSNQHTFSNTGTGNVTLGTQNSNATLGTQNGKVGVWYVPPNSNTTGNNAPSN